MKEDEENIKEKVFTIKSKYLQNVPHPKLIEKGISQLKPWINDDEIRKCPEITWPLNLKEFIEKYIDELMSVKLKIANAMETEELIFALSNLKMIQKSLIEKLAEGVVFDVSAADKIKLSGHIDAYEILKILINKRMNQNEISEYIRNQFNEKGEDSDHLVVSSIRARKILDHER